MVLIKVAICYLTLLSFWAIEIARIYGIILYFYENFEEDGGLLKRKRHETDVVCFSGLGFGLVLKEGR
jgi:hypothetical protein